MRRWALTLLTALMLSAAALALSSCGGKSTASSDPGEKLFTTVGCSNCHTLAEAHSTGVVGPNLDQLKPSLKLVRHQVTNGGGGMPSFGDALTPEQITQVATFVYRSTHHLPLSSTPGTPTS
jgi:cytochrome c6